MLYFWQRFGDRNGLFREEKQLAKEITSISFYDSIVVFEKGHNFPPFHEMMGIK